MTDALPALLTEALPASVLEQLRDGAHQARGTMAPETVRVMRKGFATFSRWCTERDTPALPAIAAAVAAYIDAVADAPGRKAAGIKQAAWAIGAVHRLGGLSDPTKAETVRLAIKRMTRHFGTRQQQAAPIGTYELRRFREAAGGRQIDMRNLAPLSDYFNRPKRGQQDSSPTRAYRSLLA